MNDPVATYVMSGRLLIAWPFHENFKIIGEESWSQPPTTTFTKAAPEDIPNAFGAYIPSKQPAT